MASTTVTIKSDTKDARKATEYLVKEVTKLREENRRLADENRKAHKEKMDQLKEEREAVKRKAREEKQANHEANEEKKRAARERHRLLDAEEKKYATHRQIIGRIGGAVMAVGGAWVSVSTMLEQINQRLERQKQLQDDLRGKSRSIGQAKENLLGNIGGYSTADQQSFLGMPEQLASQLKLGGADAVLGLTDTVGTLASSGATPSQAQSIITELAKRNRNVPQIAGRSQAILGLMSKAGMSASGAVEFFEQVGQNIYGKDPTTVVQPFAKAKTAAAVAFPNANAGSLTEQTAELYAGLTQMKEDPTGSESGTGAQRYIQKLGMFFQGNSAVTDINSARAQLRSSPTAEQQFMQSLPEEYRDVHAMFMGRVGGDAYARVQGNIDLSRSSLGTTQAMAAGDFDIQASRRGQAIEAEEFATLRRFKEQLGGMSESRQIYESVYKLGEQDFGGWMQANAYAPARYLARPFYSPQDKIRQDIAHIQRMTTMAISPTTPSTYYDQFAQMYDEGGVEGLMQDSRVSRDEANIFAAGREGIKRLEALLESIDSNTKKPTLNPQGIQEAN